MISARHCLVELSQLLRPYDRDLLAYPDDEQDAWGRFIVACLRQEQLPSSAIFYVHAGESYARPVCRALELAGLRFKVFDLTGRPSEADLE